MDLFNKKKLKRVEIELEKTRVKLSNSDSIIKYLIEEPDCELSVEIRKILTDRFSRNIWSVLTTYCHLGYMYNKESTELLAKELTKYF